MNREPVHRDPWAPLRAFTSARIGLGRAGAALRTQDILAFDLDCARARDAVDRPLDVATLTADLAPLGCVAVHSAAANRGTYLRRPISGAG
jgi:ethanolamine ammonia-lyase small subunit